MTRRRLAAVERTVRVVVAVLAAVALLASAAIVPHAIETVGGVRALAAFVHPVTAWGRPSVE